MQRKITLGEFSMAMSNDTMDQEKERLETEIKKIADSITIETEKLMTEFQREANEYAKGKVLEKNPLLKILLK
jgi:hypothetical protein